METLIDASSSIGLTALVSVFVLGFVTGVLVVFRSVPRLFHTRGNLGGMLSFKDYFKETV